MAIRNRITESIVTCILLADSFCYHKPAVANDEENGNPPSVLGGREMLIPIHSYQLILGN